MRSLKILVLLATAAGAAALAAAPPAGSATSDPSALQEASKIRFDITARYVQPGGPKLRVTEASSTGVIESFLLLTPRLDGVRVVPADNGIYYSICPLRARCPYPARWLARPAADFVPRREALELALRTFLETPVTLVAVSLPTREFRFLVFERDELSREVDMAALARALSGNTARTPALSLRRVVDQVTRPRVFVPLGLEPTPAGKDSLAAMPLWLDASGQS